MAPAGYVPGLVCFLRSDFLSDRVPEEIKKYSNMIFTNMKRNSLTETDL